MTRYERILVGFTVFNAILSVFTYFNLAYGGIGSTILGGKIGIVVFALYLLVVFAGKNTGCFDQKNEKDALIVSIVFLTIWLITWLSADFFENFFIIAIVQVGTFLLMKDSLKVKCFDWFVKVFSLILLLSLIEYVIYSIAGVGIVLFSSITRPGDNNVVLSQLLFNLLTDSDTSSIFRFQSLCEEPGVIGTVCGFLIFLTRSLKQYQKYYYIFLLAGMLSFTLSFYILFIIHLFDRSSLEIRNLALYSVIIGLGVYLFAEFINNFLLLRIVGNELTDIDNRSGGDFAYQFEQALNNGSLWLSNYKKGYDINGAGLKMFIWRYGIVSLILLFFSYSYVFWRWAKRYKSAIVRSFVFFFAFWVSFYQRHYITNMEYVLCFFMAPIFFSTVFQQKSVSIKQKGV